MILSNETQGDLTQPFLIEFLQFTVQMSKLNGLRRTVSHRECIFVVELKLKLRSLFHYEQIARENSNIK